MLRTSSVRVLAAPIALLFAAGANTPPAPAPSESPAPATPDSTGHRAAKTKTRDNAQATLQVGGVDVTCSCPAGTACTITYSGTYHYENGKETRSGTPKATCR